VGLTQKATYSNVYTTAATISPCSNTATVVKASGGVLFQIEITNTANASSAVFVRLYDSATAPTVTSVEPEHMLKVAGGQTLTMSTYDQIAFGSGIAVACTTEADLTGTAPAGSVVVRIGYT